jgi:hypothetical protein
VLFQPVDPKQLRDTIPAVLSYMFSLAIIAGYFLGKIGTEAFMTVAGMAAQYFFSSTQTQARAAQRAGDPVPPVDGPPRP